ncbi:MAG: hypothetical protein WCK89_08490 [bacterium]
MTGVSRVRFRAPWVLCVCLGLVSATGCVSTNVKVDQALSSLRAGDDPTALVWSEKLKQSVYSKQLGYLETGRIRMLSGDFWGSSTNFAAVIDTVIEKTENGPVLKMGSVGATVMAATVTDDRTRTYDVPAYEFIQSLHYQMLNHLFLRNLDAAGVEARRAVFAQDAIAEKYGKEVQDARDQSAGSSKNAAAFSKVDAQMQGMAPVIEMTRSSFENGLAWYLCGVLFEQQDDISNAALSYRKAWELVPGNPHVQKDFLRLIRTQDAEMFKGLVAQAGVDPKTLVRNRTEVILIVEESFVSQRQSVKIPLPIPGVNTLTSVDFPIYQDPAYAPMALDVREKEVSCGLSAQALSLQSLAYRDLKEKMPGIVIRNVTRAATRIAAQEVANHANDYAKYGVMAFNAVSAVINKADTRAWYTLPMSSQLYRGGVAPGEHLFELRNQVTGFVTRFPVTVAEGETRIIWVADIGGNARIATTSLNGKGGPTTFQVNNSMLAGYPAVMVPGGPRLIGGVTRVSEQKGYKR